MKKRIIALVLVTLLISLTVPNVLAGQQPAPAAQTPVFQGRTDCAEDLTGKTVTFYHFGDLSGVFTFITLPLVAGLNDAVAYFNENGGLCGAEIAVEFRDTGGDTDKTQQFWDEFSAIEGENAPAIILLYSSADGELLRDQAAEKGIPILLAAGSEFALYGEDANTPGWVYSVIPLYTDQLGQFCEYISENWEQFGIEGDPVIGHLSWLGAFGASSDTENTRAYCESLGVGYAGAEGFLPTTSSVGEQLSVLVDNGANIIYTTSLASGPALVAKAVAGAELQGQVLMAGSNWVLDTSVIGLAGQDADGFVGNLPYMWWDEIEHPGIQLVLNSWLTNRLAPAGDDPEAQRAALASRNIAYLLAFASIDLWIEIMTQSINEVGYDNLNGTVVNDVLSGGFDYAPLEGVLQISFDATTRSQFAGRIGQIQFIEGANGGVTPTILPLSDWMDAPDLRSSVDLGATGDEASETEDEGDEGGDDEAVATEEASE